MFLFSQAAETATELATELATEIATEAASVDPRNEFTLPTGYDYSAQIPKVTLMFQIMSAVILLVAIIAMFIYVNRKHKMALFSVMGGIALYVIFYYYAPNILNLIYLIPMMKPMANSVPFNILYVGIFSSLIALGGRLLSMKLYDRLGNNASTALSVGYGLAGAMAVYVALNCFFDFINCSFIDANGFEEAIWATAGSVDNQEAFEKLVKDLFQYVADGPSLYAFQLLEYLFLVIYHFAMSIILLSAYTNKETKNWYFFAFGTYAVILMGRYLRVMAVAPGIVSVLISGAVTALTGFFAWRLYKFYYKDEQRDWEEENRMKNPPKKKMPKFDNLSNL